MKHKTYRVTVKSNSDVKTFLRPHLDKSYPSLVEARKVARSIKVLFPDASARVLSVDKAAARQVGT